MSKKKSNSRVLRQLALDLVRQLAEADDVPQGNWGDLATSLVRQWLTYDGHATLFTTQRQVYYDLSRTPLGRPCVRSEPGARGGIRQITRDWEVGPEQLADILDRLNRGQSAEATSGDGVPIRFWVDPQKGTIGVEPLVKMRRPPGTPRDYRKIAASQLEQHFGPQLAADEMDALVGSVAAQWQKYDGHACLFVERAQVVFTLTEAAEGHCRVVTRRLRRPLEPLLSPLGFPPEVMPEIMVKINLNQEIEFQDQRGLRSRLWYDPKNEQIVVEHLDLDALPPAVRSNSSPAHCPNCNAVLRPWRHGEPRQLCLRCGHVVLPP